jgi:hypothetical protein
MPRPSVARRGNPRFSAAAFGTLLALIGCASLSATASAGGNAVINDCYDNAQLTHSYTLSELRYALQIMPSAEKEYSDCYSVISQAELSAVANGRHNGRPGNGSSGSFLPTPVIIVLVLLILAVVTFGAIAVRRRRASESDSPGENGHERGGPAP